MSGMLLLHSGFIAYPTNDLSKVEEGEVGFKEAVLSSSSAGLDTDNWFDREVEGLVKILLQEPNAISRFEYRESILKKALEVFGAPKSFVDWFLMQHFSPAVGYMHRRFLMETLDYVFNDVPRRMQLSTYRLILTVGNDVSRHVAADKENDFIDLNAACANLRTADNTEFFVSWTETPKKIEDLIMTLDLIFGPRVDNGG